MLPVLQRIRGSLASHGGVIAESGEVQPNISQFHDQVKVGKNYVDFTLSIPHHRKRRYDGVAIIEPGFGGIKASSEGLMRSLAALGIATACYNPIRKDHEPLHFRLIKPQAIHTDTVAAIAHNLTHNSRLLSEAPEIKSINLHRIAHLPHSMGSQPAIDHALTNPENTEMIINLATVGHGSPSIPQLLRNLPTGIPHGLLHEMLPGILHGHLEPSLFNLIQAAKYFAHNPFRTAGEAISCLTADLRPATKYLGQAGVKSAFIAFGDDCLIPQNPDIANGVDLYTVMPGFGHMAPQVRPQEVAHKIVDVMYELSIS